MRFPIEEKYRLIISIEKKYKTIWKLKLGRN